MARHCWKLSFFYYYYSFVLLPQVFPSAPEILRPRIIVEDAGFEPCTYMTGAIPLIILSLINLEAKMRRRMVHSKNGLSTTSWTILRNRSHLPCSQVSSMQEQHLHNIMTSSSRHCHFIATSLSRHCHVIVYFMQEQYLYIPWRHCHVLATSLSRHSHVAVLTTVRIE